MAHPIKQTAMAKYSFAVDGGGVSTITPAITESIPNNAIITGVYTYTDTLCTSGGSATIALTGGGVTFSAATAFGNNAYDTNEQVSHHTGLISSDLGIKATSTADIQVVIATAALTAGIFTIFVEYYLGDAEA